MLKQQVLILKLLDETVKEIDVSVLTDDLVKIRDKEEQKEVVQEIAWVTNQYLPVIELYEKNGKYLINDGTRVTGWPKGKEMHDGMAANSIMFTMMWLLEGKLHAVQN